MTPRDARLLKVQQTLDRMSATQLSVLAEYVSESNHGSWDGFTSRDVTGALRMLEDFILYVENRLTPVGPSHAKGCAATKGRGLRCDCGLEPRASVDSQSEE